MRIPLNCTTVPGWFTESRFTLTLFSVLFGLIAAVLSNYRYGLWDHAEQLPVIFRIMDPGYLANDFFVNAASEFGPRFYYSHTLAFVAGYVPLPTVVGVAWLSAFIAVVVITALAARDLSGSMLGGMIAAVLVTLPEPFYLGNRASVLYDPLLVPRTLAMPFALFALWRGIRGQPISAAIASTPAILFQPVMGLEIAGLALVAAGGRCLFLLKLRGEYEFNQLRSLALGVLIVGLASLLWIVPTIFMGASSLEADEFVHLYAYFRHPHHLIPSTWDTTQWVLGALFTSAVVIALVEAFQAETARNQVQPEHLARCFAIATTFVIIAAALVVGYVFVEIIPNRIATIAQTFRMVLVLTWLGWILMAAFVARLLVRGTYHWAALFAASVVSVPSLFLCKSVMFTASKFKDGSPIRSSKFFAGFVPLIIVTLEGTRRILTDGPATTDFLPIGLGFLLVLIVAINHKLVPTALMILAGVLVLTVTSLALERYDMLPSEVPRVSSYLADKQPIVTLDEAIDGYRHDPMVELAAAAKDTTDPDSVFLVPWNWYLWRLFSERAIVVDHKAFPFRDEGMKEWYDRYLAIYDEGAGYPESVTENELLELQKKYGFHYAVMRTKTRMSSFPVLKSSKDWKLVQVADVGPR